MAETAFGVMVDVPPIGCPVFGSSWPFAFTVTEATQLACRKASALPLCAISNVSWKS